ncbi:hypothetical protein Micbo1qcDRAFT_169596 [Microdochium bolleyi]|uniref:Uncharacterized protein n=1 Tax=Microdochium bolleyi TaxID=196109 RepID=A0A136IJQ3_9PEZI|nr:hypothetical protein Micbo1qcDRAFT_169596 [Microdochium bolleyi]
MTTRTHPCVAPCQRKTNMSSQQLSLFRAQKPLPPPPLLLTHQLAHPSLPISPIINPPLSSLIRQLEEENDRLQDRVFELETTVASLLRKHATDTARKATLLRERDQEYNRIIEQQNMMVAEVIKKIHKVFAEYREEVSAVIRSESEETCDVPAGYVKKGNWI